MTNKDLLKKLKGCEFYAYMAIREYPMSHAKHLARMTAMSYKALSRNLDTLEHLGFVERFIVKEKHNTIKRYKVIGPNV